MLCAALTVIALITIKSVALNNTAELMSNYSKVVHWGRSVQNKPLNEGRSNGQSFWTHRSDATIRRSQNLNKKQPVTYYYSMKTPASKLDETHQENLPAKGEVQERFNPRPYFDFTFDDPPGAYPQTNQTKTIAQSENPKQTDFIYGSPVDSYSVLNGFTENRPLDNDTYNSPFSSYNPSTNKPDYTKNSFNVPLNGNAKPSVFYGPVNPPTPNELPIDEYENPNKPLTPTDFSYRPPLVVPYGVKDPPLPQKHVHSHVSALQTNNEDADYYPQPPINEADEGMVNDNHNLHPLFSVDHGPTIIQTVKPPGDEELLDQHPRQPPLASMAEGDLSPPPVGVPYGKIPEYLNYKPSDYEFHNFDHHNVYHEIHHTTALTTTTTEAPRAGHYSYYYLGRKLWYIPLYFSVYFIVYVTILILKSIARHKIQFSHNFDKGRSSKQLDIDTINKTVIASIINVENKYM